MHIFHEQVRYAQSLIKRRPIGTAGRWRWELVSPEDVINELEQHGVSLSIRTLQRWVKDGLIPEPERGSHGQGRGTWANYPDDTVPQALTVQVLRKAHKLKHDQIADARRVAQEGVHSLFPVLWNYYTDRFAAGKNYNGMLEIARQVTKTAGLTIVDGMLHLNLPDDLYNFGARHNVWADVFDEIVKEQGFMPISHLIRRKAKI